VVFQVLVIQIQFVLIHIVMLFGCMSEIQRFDKLACCFRRMVFSVVNAITSSAKLMSLTDKPKYHDEIQHPPRNQIFFYRTCIPLILVD
jgi:hypothetical protein